MSLVGTPRSLDGEHAVGRAVASGPALCRELDSRLVVGVGVLGAVVVGAALRLTPMAGAAVVIAIAIGLTVLRTPAVGGYLVVGLVPVTAGLKRGFPLPGFRVSEVLVVGVALLVLVPATARESSRWRPFDALLLIYGGLSVALPALHLASRGESIGLGVLGPTLLPLQFFLIYRTVRVALFTETQRAFGLRLLLLSSLPVSVLAALQQLDIGPARSMVQRVTDSDAIASSSYEVAARATGPFQHWLPLAGYLTVIIVTSISLLVHRRFDVFSRRWLAVVLIAALSALMLSITFTSMAAISVAALYLGWRTGRLRMALRWWIGGAMVMLLVFAPFVVARVHSQYRDSSGLARNSLVPQTVQNRIDVWSQQYIPAMSDHWAFGYGPDLPPGIDWGHTESVYLTVMLRGGVVLLALFVAGLAALSLAASRVAVESTQRRPLARAVIALIGVLWVMDLLYPYLTSSGLSQSFWVLVALAFAGRETMAGISADTPELNSKVSHL